MFKGSFVAIVTPFKNGKVDEKVFEELIEFQIQNGTHGIVPCGTTGESATLSHEEHDRVIEIAVEVVKKRVPVIAGTGSNSTDEAITLTKHAREVGADGALLITPYYNKPSQEGLYRHFQAISEAVDIPQILYNVPGRTSVNMLPETVARLSKFKNIVGIKEATGDLSVATEIIALCGSDFDVLSGDDAIIFPMLCVGGCGVISVVANIVPDEVSTLCTNYEEGKIKDAEEIHYRLRELNKAMFIETNPVPVKTALFMMGRIESELRLPLCEMSENNRSRLQKILKEYNLI